MVAGMQPPLVLWEAMMDWEDIAFILGCLLVVGSMVWFGVTLALM